MCEIKGCTNTASIKLSDNLIVCAHHAMPDVNIKNKFICKLCGVRVVSKTNNHAIYGQEHSKGCQRKNR